MKLANMSAPDLIKNFEALALRQYDANMNFHVSRYDRAFDAMAAVSRELRGRPGDQRRELVALHNHPNEQVRLKAAIHTLARPALASATRQSALLKALKFFHCEAPAL